MARFYAFIPPSHDCEMEWACDLDISAPEFIFKGCAPSIAPSIEWDPPSTEWDPPSRSSHSHQAQDPRLLLPVPLTSLWQNPHPCGSCLNHQRQTCQLRAEGSAKEVSISLSPTNHSLSRGNPCSGFPNPLGTVPGCVTSTVPGIPAAGEAPVT